MGALFVIGMAGACLFVFRTLFPDKFNYNTGYGNLLHPAVVPFYVFMVVATGASLLAVNTADFWLAAMLTFDIVATPVVAIASFIGYNKRKNCKIQAEHRLRQTEWEKARQGKADASTARAAGSVKASAGGSAGPAYLLYEDGEGPKMDDRHSSAASSYEDLDAMDDYLFGEDILDAEDFLDWEAGYTETSSHREEHAEPEYRQEESNHHEVYEHYDDDFGRE